MRPSHVALALSTAPFFAQALPLFGRQPSAIDVTVFKFANALEQLETEFYTQAIAKFKVQDFIDAGYVNAEVAVEQLQAIVKDESIHTSVLETAIKSFGEEPLTCTFNFDSVLTDVATTMAVARVVELVGVAAYMGGAGLLDDPRFITTAASILTVEARHQSILNVLNGGAAAGLQAFDIPLSPPQVLSVAGGFVTSGCDFGITPTDPLTLTNNGTIAAGTLLTFQSKGITESNGKKLFCNMIVGGAATSINLPIEECIVPPGINGPVMLFITGDDQPLLASNIIDQDPKCIVSGPAITFLDFGVKQQTLAQLVLTPQSPLNKDLTGLGGIQAQSCPNGEPCTPVASDSTSTISPDQASTVLSSGETATPPSPQAATVAPSPSATTVGNPPVLPTSEIFMGDMIPLVPSPGAGEPTENGAINVATPTIGSDGLPLPSATTPAVGSDGLPLPSATTPAVGSDGLPLPSDVPESGAGSSGNNGEIVPLVPIAGAEPSGTVGASNPEASDIVPVVAA